LRRVNLDRRQIVISFSGVVAEGRVGFNGRLYEIGFDMTHTRFDWESVSPTEVQQRLDDFVRWLPYGRDRSFSLLEEKILDLFESGWEIIVIPPLNPQISQVVVDEFLCRLSCDARLWVVEVTEIGEIEAVYGIDIPRAA
jgi:hypothetical protein